MLGLRDFVRKTGFKKVHFGLSGGLDSALVALIAVEALGPDAVEVYALPGPYNTKQSLTLARSLAQALGICLHELSIDAIYSQLKQSLQTQLSNQPNKSDQAKLQTHSSTELNSICQQNLQARARAVLLMGISNQYNSLLLNTSNKSELAMGYGTLYGDLAGGLCVIGDVLKTQVFQLARLYANSYKIHSCKTNSGEAEAGHNSVDEASTTVFKTYEGVEALNSIMARPPSAELWPNQKDEDSLPPYAQLDPLIDKFIRLAQAPQNNFESKIFQQIMRSEFKRWQSAPVLKISSRAFGRGRRYPIAYKRNLVI